MNCKIYCTTSDDGGWAEVASNTGTIWETVYPKDRTIYHYDDHICQYFPEWKIFRTSLVLSSMTLICSSTSGTFFSAAAILIFNLGKSSLIASNSLLPLIKLTTNPYLSYNCMKLVITFTNWEIFLLLMNIEVVYLRRQETVTRN